MPTQLNVSDVKLESIDIQAASGGFDLIPHLEELNIYESIFSNYLTAHITLVDAVNLPVKLPIIGDETIHCKIRMEGEDGTHTVKPPPLHVYNLSDRFLRNYNPSSERFSLDLISEQGMSNYHSKVSKAYSHMGMTADQIVMDIWYTYLDHGGAGSVSRTLTTERTAGIEQCIIPNWTPFQAFNWLASRSITDSENPISNFLYFETMDHSYFQSFNRLVTQKPTIMFKMEHSVIDPHKIEGLAEGVVKVNEIIYLNQFDRIDNTVIGKYSSKLVTHDITKKQIFQHDYVGDDWENANHLAPYPSTSNSVSELQTAQTSRKSYAPPVNPATAIADGTLMSSLTDGHVAFYPKHNKMYGADPATEYDNQVEKWRLQRNAHMAWYDGIKMQVRCGGIHALRIGMPVILIVPSPEACIRPEDAVDKALTGTYIITAIRHIIGNEKGNVGYKMDVELVKDGYDVFPLPRVPKKQGGVYV